MDFHSKCVKRKKSNIASSLNISLLYLQVYFKGAHMSNKVLKKYLYFIRDINEIVIVYVQRGFLCRQVTQTAVVTFYRRDICTISTQTTTTETTSRKCVS